jgi:hypothetical protein
MKGVALWKAARDNEGSGIKNKNPKQISKRGP